MRRGRSDGAIRQDRERCCEEAKGTVEVRAIAQLQVVPADAQRAERHERLSCWGLSPMSDQEAQASVWLLYAVLEAWLGFV